MSSPPTSAQENHPPPPAPLSDPSPLPPSSSDSLDPASSPSSQIFSQINSTSPHLHSISTATAAAVASKYGATMPYYESSAAASAAVAEASSSSAPVVPPMLEKCVSFCAQKDGGRPMCRMFCVRKRTGMLSREDQLKRLRPVRAHGRAAAADPSSSAPSIDQPTSHATTPALAPERPIPFSGLVNFLSNPPPFTSILRMPFDAVRDRVFPYSFVYVRGTPDGVVGRYMEELEWDDGVYDFEGVSRGALAKGAGRKQEEEVMIKKLDWGENGYLLHLPAVSLLSPIITFPEKTARVFSPIMNFANAYITSFTSGHQGRVRDMFIETVRNGGGLQFLGKMRGYWAGRWDAYSREVVERAEASAQRKEEVKEVGKEKEGEESQ